MKLKLSNRQKVIVMVVLTLLACAAYVLIGLAFGKEKLFHYQLNKRIPKLIVMAVTAFAIGGASIVFQTIINNTIVTPCLLLRRWLRLDFGAEREPGFPGGSGHHGLGGHADLQLSVSKKRGTTSSMCC